MSNEYTPDKWVMLKITTKDSFYYKILSGWSGGYLYGDSWRMNSGVTRVDDKGDYYEIYGYSGSVYTCFKSRYGLSVVTSGILKRLQDDSHLLDTTVEFLEETEFEKIEYV